MSKNNNQNDAYYDRNASQIYYAGSGVPVPNLGYSVDASGPYNPYNYSVNGGGGGGGVYYSQPGGAIMIPDKSYIINTEPITINTKDNPIVLVDPILETHVKSYLTWSLFNVLFCFCFGGILTTFMSCNVMRLNDSKNYKEALRLSGKVLIANMVVTGLGALLFLIVFPHIYIAIYPFLPKINW
jgi:hypothetical protein